MAKQTIGIGTVANDGTGDSLRDAFDKINDNFDEIYSAFTFASNNATYANNVLTGNSTVNAIANSTALWIRNATNSTNVTAAGLRTGSVIVNSSGVAVNANVTITNTHIKFGNTTQNSVVNSTFVQLVDASGSANVTPRGMVAGNTVANSTVVKADSANIVSNTFAFGTSSVAANGYSRLPNGLLLQWGTVSSNTSVGNITFPTGFTALYSFVVTAESATYDSTYVALPIASNTTTANVRTGNATAISVRYTAIGT